MDGRRHSIDVPISRALIALRRVRSLRDPSTNSMSKFPSFVDNLNWETNSNNAITLGFENSGHELYYGSRHSHSRLVSPETLADMVGKTGLTPQRLLHFEGADAHSLHREIVCENKALSERYGNDYGLEGGSSFNEADDIMTQAQKRRSGVSKCKNWHRKLDGLSRVTAGDVTSRAESPCLSMSEAPKEGSTNGLSLHRNEDFGFMDSCHQGCGISSCWSINRKFRDSSLYPDVEEQPLLLDGEKIDWKHNVDGVSPYTESPRNLCQKFMPKSFGELVGQSIVATSLLNAVSNRNVASLYLFHGPRGTGKTSASRIFAAALNCLSPENARRPCVLCQECVLFFSGRSRDVKEVDSVRINRTERCRLLVKNAGAPPVFSRFKVYVIDECHMLSRETWANLLNCLEDLPRHVVFIMVTPNLDKLPRSAVSKSQTYHFQKVKQVDISSRLEKICGQEGIDFDQDALKFIATKSNGSLRDAEMMLDQLSLLGRKITVSLVYEVVSAKIFLLILINLQFANLTVGRLSLT